MTNNDEKQEKPCAAPVSGTVEEGRDDGENHCEYPTGLEFSAILTALILAVFLSSLDFSIIATAVPRITSDFHDLNDAGWFGSSVLLTAGATQAMWGKAYKFFDLKTMFLLVVGIFELGSLLCGIAQNSKTLVVGRAIIGAGAAGILVGAYVILALIVPPQKIPAYSGIIGATYSVANVIAPPLGGVLTDALSWRWCFFINMPLGALAAVIILFTCRRKGSSAPEDAPGASIGEKVLQMDVPGIVLAVAAITCLLLALQQGGIARPWNDQRIIGYLVGSILLTIGFMANEYLQGSRAMIVADILRKRLIWSACLFEFLYSGAFTILQYYIPFYFQAVLGASAVSSGLRNLALILSYTFVVILSGIAMSTFGHFTLFVIVGSCISTVGCGMIYTWSVASTAPVWIGYQLLFGAGSGLCYQTPIMAAQALSSSDDLPSTTAMLLFFQTLGGAVTVSAAQSAFTNQVIKSIRVHDASLDSSHVISLGASRIHDSFHDTQLQAILLSIMDGLRASFILSIVLAGLASMTSAMLPWVNIKQKKKSEPS